MTLRETERYELYFCPVGMAYRVMDNYTTSVSNLLTAVDTWEEAERAQDMTDMAFEDWCDRMMGYTPTYSMEAA